MERVMAEKHQMSEEDVRTLASQLLKKTLARESYISEGDFRSIINFSRIAKWNLRQQKPTWSDGCRWIDVYNLFHFAPS
jgi:DNA polymerase III delta prime subunit